ncbi:SsrA-binding protein [Pullulanibacillus pueri]|uniref:SsrA-binding protein n=1 Tax=Pullulanibacillus pueri TaxID=1437324 RepID=A0A8J3EKJ4_9BACL|nr:SsrA-binding protein SmpB [Pullulanibacillus pueri]MBM7680256.1 SsrA-binding protein [Pullulanibacillus pueri]GGH75991.1 SsrA-binding protein [Pullulanibacillus pueri]
MADKKGRQIAENKRARHDYFIEDTFEAGLVLQGTEIKSIRKGSINFKDAFARVDNGEVFLHNMHIAPYEQGNRYNHDPLRTRKLLLHKKEINKLIGISKESGYTIVPLKMYIKNGFAKVLIGVGKGKKNYDKRETLKKKTAERQIAKALRQSEKGM